MRKIVIKLLFSKMWRCERGHCKMQTYSTIFVVKWFGFILKWLREAFPLSSSVSSRPRASIMFTFNESE